METQSKWIWDAKRREYFYWDRDERTGKDIKIYQAKETLPSSQAYRETPRQFSSANQGRYESESSSNAIPIPNSSAPLYGPSTVYAQPQSAGAYTNLHASANYQGSDWAASSADAGHTPKGYHDLASGMHAMAIGDRSEDQYTHLAPQQPSFATSLPATNTYLSGSAPAQWPTTSYVGTSGLPGTYSSQGAAGVTSQEAADKLYVAPTEGDRKDETLDKSYKIRNHDWKKWFRTGRVFSTLWTDAYGRATNQADTQFQSSVSVVQYGERVHSKIRRFVVVRFDPANKACTCLPITTYDGRGIDKRDIKLSEHGQIYSGDKAPSHINGLRYGALRVKVPSGSRGLDRQSYINYGRPYTVNTNVKVKDVGELDSASRRLLRKHYSAVNFPEDDSDYSDTGPPRTAEQRAAIIAGTGGAVADPPINYSGNPSGWTANSSFAPVGQSSYITDPVYGSHSPPTAPVPPSSVRYPNQPVYELKPHSTSSTIHQQRDDAYFDNSSATVGAGSAVVYSRDTDHAYSNTPAQANETDSQYYDNEQYDRKGKGKQRSRSRGRGEKPYGPQVASGQYSSFAEAPATGFEQPYPEDEDDLYLPTVEETKQQWEARTGRRYSTSQHGGGGHSHGGRDRPRERGRDREEGESYRDKDGRKVRVIYIEEEDDKKRRKNKK